MDNSFVGIAMAAFLLVGISSSARAGDGPRCSASTLSGTYVFSASGFTVDPVSGVVRPKAIVEVTRFNGDGTLAVVGGTRSVNGVVAPLVPNVYAYTVADDCSGTITFDGPAFDIFIAPEGDRLWMIQTNPGNVFEGSATRTSRARTERDGR
jgi:hypothetical protein